MSDLEQAVALLGKPYTLTRSRIGVITKIFEDNYICDANALRELFETVGEKLDQLTPENVRFSFLISYSDKTHHDGVIADLQEMATLPTGKHTERAVLKWVAVHKNDGYPAELTVTVRIANPINPLVFLQAALSKSANDIDNLEFEMGSTCVTVDGSGQMYADEVFHAIKGWIEARNKPHRIMDFSRTYKKFEWYIDQFNVTILPLLALSGFALFSYNTNDLRLQAALAPLAIGFFIVIQGLGGKLNVKMDEWSRRSRFFSVFQLTNGDVDVLTKLAARSKNSSIKLVASWAISLALNILAGVICFYLLKA